MPDGGSRKPKINMEIRILMTSVAMLHETYPDQHCFSEGEVAHYRSKVLERYPELKNLQ
jgi:hypothetical protein